MQGHMRCRNVLKCAALAAGALLLAGWSAQAQETTNPGNMDQGGVSQGSMAGNAGNGNSGNGNMDMRAGNADMLIQTLSEEQTEIRQLAAQQAMLRKMGGRQDLRIAAMFGRWIREHKAAGPTLMRLTRQNGGDPSQAKFLKSPALGDKMHMLHATMMDHMKAVMASQERYAMTSSPAIKRAMHRRANLARKHMRQMHPYHNENNCPMCRDMMQNGNMNGMHMGGMHMGGNGSKMAMMCPHCNVKMVNGKCPMCGMTMEQMKGDMHGGNMSGHNMNGSGMSGKKMGAQETHSAKMAMTCPHCNVKIVNGKCPMCGMTMAQKQGGTTSTKP